MYQNKLMNNKMEIALLLRLNIFLVAVVKANNFDETCIDLGLDQRFFEAECLNQYGKRVCTHIDLDECVRNENGHLSHMNGKIGII